MIRIGHGYDVHKLVPERRLILGGVDIPFDLGLLGHSDADVLVHALMDSLLGASCLGDIGKLFPDNDNTYLAANSLDLLKTVNRLLSENGFSISNVDITVIAQRPKLSPYIYEMRNNISQCLSLPLDCISIKATTEEGLGFTGEGRGIAAHAVCLLEK